MILYKDGKAVATVSVLEAVRWSQTDEGRAWLKSVPRARSMPARSRATLVCAICDKMLIKGRCLCGEPTSPRRVYIRQSRPVCSDQLCARRSGHKGLHTWERLVLNSRDPVSRFK